MRTLVLAGSLACSVASTILCACARNDAATDTAVATPSVSESSTITVRTDSATPAPAKGTIVAPPAAIPQPTPPKLIVPATPNPGRIPTTQGTPPASAPAPDPSRASSEVSALVQRSASVYAKAKTLTGRFEQTLTNSLTGSVLHARGSFEQRQPDKLAISYSDPAGDRIVADGTSLWVYVPSTAPGQVIKMPQTSAGAGSVDLVRQFLTDPVTRYTIGDAGTANIDGRATRAVTLVPKAAGMNFTKATVWIDPSDATIRQFEVAETSGLTRLVRITSLTLNGAVDASAFMFAVPNGVKILEQ